MKKTFFLMVVLFALACEKSEEADQFGIYSDLNENAIAFMKDLRAVPGWESSWNKLSEEGTPILNEVVTVITIPRGFYYVLPVVSDNAVESIVVYQFECSEGRRSILGSPTVVDRDNTAENPIVEGILQGSVAEVWKTKGYRMGIEYENEEECEDCHEEGITASLASSYSETYYSHRFLIYMYFYGPGNPEHYFALALIAARNALESFTSPDVTIWLTYGNSVSDEHSIYTSGRTDLFGVHEWAVDQLCWSMRDAIMNVIYLQDCWIHHYSCYYLGFMPPGGGGGGGNNNGGGTTNPPLYNVCNCNPCLCVLDLANNRSIPLKQMELQPPNDYNIAGATFGPDVRTNDDGTPKAHQGIDLYGTVGTRIYSLFEGTVVAPLVTEQPNRESNSYPAGYSGDADGSGNRIYIQSTVNGETITIAYWHLQAGTPVGTNPATGQPYQIGDTVQAGAIVGYVGISGNPNPLRPHLHLGVRNSAGTWINPTNYLNATISTTSTEITIGPGSTCYCI